MNLFKILLVAGARPNFMKIAPLMKALKKRRGIKTRLIHTGQHYDRAMSKVFFDELEIPRPDKDLGVGSGSQAEQTGWILMEFDKLLAAEKPDLVVVVGDVNSTVACSLAAAKRGIKITHVEAGLRSFDRSMPEEINRVLTDQLSDLLFCTEPSGVKNLLREGIARRKIFFTGNVMIDTLRAHQKKAEKSCIRKELGLEKGRYGLITLHRPANVDTKEKLAHFLKIFEKIAAGGLPLIFPVHPRTRKNMEQWGLKPQKIRLTAPLGYLDFLKLMSHAAVMLTDSGGIQEETTILGVPCLTLRENTERPVTLTEGTNELVGSDERKILAAVRRVMNAARKKPSVPKFWDGKAAERIVNVILVSLRGAPATKQSHEI